MSTKWLSVTTTGNMHSFAVSVASEATTTDTVMRDHFASMYKISEKRQSGNGQSPDKLR